MEYEYYMQLFGNSTTFDEYHQEGGSYMLAWMATVPDLPYHFANNIIANMPSPRY